MQGYLNVLILLVCVFWCSFNADARTRKLTSTNSFLVGNYGARADGRTDDSQAFMKAWKAACASSGDVTVVIPQGTYYLGPVKFTGPCKNVHTITVNLQGTLKASTDLNKYDSGDDWVEFKFINGLRLTGGGTFDGQGSSAWGNAQCPKNKNCKSVMFVNLNDTIIYGMNSVNPKFFHIGVLQSNNFYASEMYIEASEDSPNTDGIHIERSSGVTIHDVFIGTGDDCISIGQGSIDILISNVTCGPGHGISVGSLGKYPNEEDVRGLVVRDSTIINTMNGVRIKTWQNSPSSSSATNITFENIIMKNVNNPIIIDQTYCPENLCDGETVPSRVSISDVYFKEINGTSVSQVAVTLNCSQGTPCQNIHLEDILLKYVGEELPTAVCAYADTYFSSPMLPLPCN
ncbi:exopolygalacturonase [Carex littledalei]|uniref:Exopolygalacturonase n=1 Tax=Carex littledalei TaxID=544730 RepID=A0A833RAJ0_9POAL|nr:exopolygalacturonase [Carex littledalei]